MNEAILPEGLLISVAGARGIIGQGMDIVTAARLAAAFSSTLPPGRVVVARDTRPSGRALELACIAAILSSGRDCIDLDIATTPTVEMAVPKLGAAGGIAVTASHNPVEWNALKFLGERGIFIGRKEGEKLLDALEPNPSPALPVSFGKLTRYRRASRDHIEAILSLPIVDSSKIARRGFRVVLDCTNGAGSVIAPALLTELGVSTVRIDCSRSGDFRRDPEPRPENLSRLARRVGRCRADLGFALDPDGDRLALVDPVLGAVSEEYTLMLAVDYVLRKSLGGDVVVNMSTSSGVEKIASRYGVSVVRTQVGEAHVVEKMLELGSPIGGEGNGGVILPALHPGRDGILAMALILQLLAETDLPLRDILSSYPRFSTVKVKIPLEGKFDSDKISDIIRERRSAWIDTRDGVRAELDEGWFHIRPSNTESVVRVIAEGQEGELAKELSEEAVRILKESWQD